MGPYEEFYHDYLVHVLSPESHRFIPHTAETFKVMCNNISTAVLEGRPNEVKKLEQIYAIESIRQISNPKDSKFLPKKICKS